jgi:hypothetical protein
MLCAAIAVAAVIALPDRPSPAPRDVVKAFYDAANSGRVTEARDYFTPGTVKQIESALGGARAFESFCEDQTQRRTMTRLEIVEEHVDQRTAKVAVRLEFKDGGLALRTEYLENRDGRWRLATEPSTTTP